MLESAQLRAPDDPSGAFVIPAGGRSRLASESFMPVDGRPLADLLAEIPEVRPGSLFFAVPGGRTDGHLFAGHAAAAGAVAVVVERWLDVSCAQVLVASVRRAMGPISAAFFGRPSARMSMVGVTGTNGKT